MGNLPSPFSRAVLCDALVLAVGLALTGPIRRWLEVGTAGFNENDSGRSIVLGLVVGGAMAGYALGCWLKRGPLQARLERSDSSGCLIVAWFALMLSLCIFGATIVVVELGLEPDSGWSLLVLFAIALTPVVFGARAMAGGSEVPAWRTHPAAGVVADVVLVASIVPVVVLWQGWISGIFTQNLAEEGLGTRLFAAVMAMAAFSVFYFAPRLVLVYDRITEKTTWAWFAVAAAPVLRACLFPGMKMAAGRS